MKVEKHPLFADLTFDEERYVKFLHEHGATDDDIEGLTVWFATGTEDDIVAMMLGNCALGAYLVGRLYVVPVRGYSTYSLNHTLLHETRHFLQEIGLGPVKIEWDEHGRIPHDDMPHEIDADEFADNCLEQGISFIGPDDIVERIQARHPDLYNEWMADLLTYVPDSR